jgi:hypothetical protein
MRDEPDSNNDSGWKLLHLRDRSKDTFRIIRGSKVTIRVAKMYCPEFFELENLPVGICLTRYGTDEPFLMLE